MQTRALGKTELEIVPLVLGGNVFGWTIDEAQSFGILDAFVDRGFNCIDTADVYSVWMPGHVGGESETILGKWVCAQRKAQQCGAGDQGRHEDAVGRRALEEVHSGRSGAVAAASADRPHRSVSVAQRRSEHAVGGDAGSVLAG